MTSRRTARTRSRLAGLLVVVVAIAAALGPERPASSPTASASIAAAPVDVPPRELSEADGAVPDNTTVFDDGIPGVANLDADLLGALRQAATDAGIEFIVDSGWRSPAYQEHLLRKAVAKYGSAQEAARWVATPETSAHVSGDAVDVGPSAAAQWLSERGAEYGLCQIYRNEPWHFELRPEAPAYGCPRTYADPTHDPRMQR